MTIALSHSTRNRPKIGLYHTKRDLQALAAVHRLKQVRESALHALCYPTVRHQKNVQASLKRLVDARYLLRRLPPVTRNASQEFTEFTHHDRREVHQHPADRSLP